MKKSSKLPLIISIVVAVVAIGLVAGIVFVVTTFFRGSSDKSADYSAAVRMIESANKTFAAGEVAKVGPYDITATAQKDYTPSQTEADAAQKELNRAQRSNSINNRPDAYGYSLTEETGQYILVTLNLKYDAARAGYDDLSTSSKDWVRQFADMTLTGHRPLVLTPDIEAYKTAQQLTADSKSTEGATLTLLYRVPRAETALTLNYDITIFTKVSPFVGTEGMPSKEYEYTIGIQ